MVRALRPKAWAECRRKMAMILLVACKWRKRWRGRCLIFGRALKCSLLTLSRLSFALSSFMCCRSISQNSGVVGAEVEEADDVLLEDAECGNGRTCCSPWYMILGIPLRLAMRWTTGSLWRNEVVSRYPLVVVASTLSSAMLLIISWMALPLETELC